MECGISMPLSSRQFIAGNGIRRNEFLRPKVVMNHRTPHLSPNKKAAVRNEPPFEY